MKIDRQEIYERIKEAAILGLKERNPKLEHWTDDKILQYPLSADSIFELLADATFAILKMEGKNEQLEHRIERLERQMGNK